VLTWSMLLKNRDIYLSAQFYATLPATLFPKILLILSAASFLVVGIWLLPARPSHASGNTYYVATNGSDSNRGTESLPFKTLQKAADIVKTGDTVLVRGGRYAGFGRKNLHGAPGAPITFKAARGQKVTLDRHITPPTVCAVICLYRVASYLVFDGFEITETDPELDRIRRLNLKDPSALATYLAWRSNRENRLKDLRSIGVRMESDPERSHHITFQNLEIHHMGMGFSGRIDFGQFFNNHVHHLPQSYGWYVGGDQNVWRGNQVHHTIFGFHLRVGVTNAVIEQNLIYSNGGTYYQAEQVKTTGAGIWTASGQNSTIRNNVIFDNKLGYGGLALHPGSNSKVSNNTFYGNKVAISVNGNNVTIQNNIIYNNDKDINGRGSGTVISNNLSTNPQFVNASGGDFHLTPSSPAIDTGISLPEVLIDFECTPRPQGTSYDIGADELGPAGENCGGSVANSQ
jgi:parallel beta-helix repeat protein